MDNLDKSKRSENMRRIKSKNTSCELQFRKAIHRIGFRYSIHKSNLPGKPDLYLAKYKIAVFINGCFWHLHSDCSRANLPKSNTAYWQEKLVKNRMNDVKNAKLLNAIGIRVFIVWECELSHIDTVLERFMNFLTSGEPIN